MGASVTGSCRRIREEDLALVLLAGAVAFQYMDGELGRSAVWRARRVLGAGLVRLGERLMPRLGHTPARIELWWEMDDDKDDDTGNSNPTE